MNSLHRPVYMHGKAMAQCPIPMRPAKPPQRPNSPPPPSPITPGPSTSFIPAEEEAEEIEEHIPYLICRSDCKMVVPHEATRDVLMGRVSYYLLDENGVQKYIPKHMFCALKLNKKQRDKYGEYPVVGAHQRFLPKKEVKKRNYKRHYISQEVGARGVYGRYADRYNYSREPLPMTALYGASYRPRA